MPTLRVGGAEIIIVSSGAIALGRRTLGLPKGKLRLEQKQAAAAVGQIALAQAWSEALRTRNMVAAQVLVTLTDTEERRRYLNARATLSTLLEQGAVPVINENDTVATSEIRYGDNDRLAARVASMMSADCLVLLSDIDGLYTRSARTSKGARLHPRSDGHHARDRGHGGQARLGRGLRRHDHQDRGGKDRAGRRLQHGDRLGP